MIFFLCYIWMIFTMLLKLWTEGEVGSKGQISKDSLKWLNQYSLKHKRALVESEVEMCWLCHDSALKRSSRCSKVLFSFSHDSWGCIWSEVNCDQSSSWPPRLPFTLAEELKYFRNSHLGTDWCQFRRLHCSGNLEAARPNRLLMSELI